jgi:hypothetical protein
VSEHIGQCLLHDPVDRGPTAGGALAEFLSSLIMDDLGLVADRAGRDDLGPALRDYLRPQEEIDTGARIDVRENLEAVLDAALRVIEHSSWQVR